MLEDDDGMSTSRSSSLPFSSHFQSSTATTVATTTPTRMGQDRGAPPSAVETRTMFGATGKAYSSRLREAYRQKDVMHSTAEGRIEELHALHRSHGSWRFYRTLCQFRFGYLAFLVVMVILMFSFTLLMEMFFAVFLPSAKANEYYIVRAVVLLVLLPIILFFLSYLFELSWRLFLDAINKADGSLPNFRLALAVVIHYIRHRKEINEAIPSEEEQAEQDPEELAEQDDIVQSTMTRRSSAGATTTRYNSRSTLLLSAKRDPFRDDDKEEEDEAWERLEEQRLAAEEQQEAAQVASSELANSEAGKVPSTAASRWKRAKAAVKATVLIKQVQDDGPSIDLSTFIIVDLVCPVMFEILTAGALLWKLFTTWSMSDAFLAYVQMGFWILSAYLVLWMVTHFWSSRNSKMRILVSNYRRRRRTTLRAVSKLERQKRSENLWLLDVGFRFYHHVGVALNPMAWCGKTKNSKRKDPQHDDTTPNVAVPINGAAASEGNGQEAAEISGHMRRLEHIREVRAKLRAKNPWNALSYNVRALILLIAVIGSALLSIYSFLIGWPIMGICLIALSSVTQRRFPQVFGNGFRHFITAFVIVSLVFFSSAIIIGTFASTGSFQLGPFVNGTSDASMTQVATDSLTINGKAITFDSSSQYPACSIDYDNLTVMDFALMADAAYGSSTEQQKEALTNRFNGTALGDWEYVNRNNDSDYQVWMELYFPTINMTVIAVRGTASATDALEDMHFWFGITIMQAVNVFVPFLKQLPRKFIVRMLSMNLLAAVMPDPVYTPLVNHVVDVRARVGGDNLVLTGHSLGGAIAAMAGAKTKTRAVSFSGPGLLYSLGRFDIDAQDVRDYVLTMKPRKDIVPQVDQLGGMVQEIRCKHSSPMSCHSTTTHLCELYYSCGDSRNRNWNETEVCIEYGELAAADDDDDASD